MKFRNDKSLMWGPVQLKNVLLKGYEILDGLIASGRIAELTQLKPAITFLEGLIAKLYQSLSSSSSTIAVSGTALVEGKVDPYELVLELQNLSTQERAAKLKDYIARRPFDDLDVYVSRT